MRSAPATCLAEIETDKATMEIEAVDEGRLGKILIADGTEGVAVNTPIALLLEEGEDASAAVAPASHLRRQAICARQAIRAASGTRRRCGRHARRSPNRATAPIAAAGSSRARSPSGWPSRPGSISAGSRAAGRMAGSSRSISSARSARACRQPKPPRRRAAAERPQAPAAPTPGPAPMPMPAVQPPAAAFTEQPLSNMRKVIARRLTEAKQTIPHFYLSMDCELDALLKLRQELNGRAGADYKLSVNDFVIKAAALALRKVPKANASFGGDKIYLYRDVDIGVAVAIPDGLVTPVIRNADHKGLAAISKEMRDLSARARDPGGMKLKPEEYQGGSLSISNLGMYGVRDFQAVINPPQASILAIGAGELRPVIKDGALASATMMTVTLSIDHRVVDGALGAELLQAFKGYLQDPLAMLL